MITNKFELKEFILADCKAKNRVSSKIKFHDDPIWKFQVLTRELDYLHSMRNKHSCFSVYRILYCIKRKRWDRLALKLGFTISYRNIDKGLAIVHYGLLVINGGAKIGKNFRVHEGVTIGATNGGNAPIIGDNVFVGTGAKIIGDISIADDVCIGAGAVVTKSILQPGTTWAGVPAVKISNNNSHKNLSPQLFCMNNGKDM